MDLYAEESFCKVNIPRICFIVSSGPKNGLVYTQWLGIYKGSAGRETTHFAGQF